MTTAVQDVMSTSEAARALGVASETLRAWVRAGKINGQVTPLGLLFDAAAVHRLAGERERSSTAQRTRQVRGVLGERV